MFISMSGLAAVAWLAFQSPATAPVAPVEPVEPVAPVVAEQAPAEKQARPEKIHIRGGHRFLPSLTLGSPFVDTHITLATAVGVLDRDITILGRTRELNLAAISPILETQIRVYGRLGVTLAGSGTLVAGTKRFSVLAYGASTSYLGRFGLTYEILHTPNSAITLALDAAKPKTVAVSPLQSAVTAVRELAGRETNPEYVNESVATQYRPAVRFAHAFHPSFGIQGLLNGFYNLRHSGDDTTEAWRVNGGLGLSSDLRPLIRVPVGISLNFLRTQAIEEDETSGNSTTVGLYETVTPYAAFGIEGGVSRSGNDNTYLGAALLRAYYE